MPKIPVLSFDRTEDARWQLAIDRFPDVCPRCGRGGKPDFVISVSDAEPNEGFIAIFASPHNDCRALYLGAYTRYTGSRDFFLSDSGLPHVYTNQTEFSEHVKTVSPSFEKIYNQAETAEQNGLTEICGAGYRRSLEFLIKEFILSHEMKETKDEKERQKVLDLQLGKCIEKFISDERIKKAAKRAAWLGNDETHYVRTWTDRDLTDLKKLIEMTVSWIDLVVASDYYEVEMPEKEKGQE